MIELTLFQKGYLAVGDLISYALRLTVNTRFTKYYLPSSYVEKPLFHYTLSIRNQYRELSMHTVFLPIYYFYCKAFMYVVFGYYVQNIANLFFVINGVYYSANTIYLLMLYYHKFNKIISSPSFFIFNLLPVVSIVDISELSQESVLHCTKLK